MNKQCGIIYNNLIDNTENGDIMVKMIQIIVVIARCGMPVNSLLEESSYGCKILCQGRVVMK